jgi:hypothetical protein
MMVTLIKPDLSVSESFLKMQSKDGRYHATFLPQEPVSYWQQQGDAIVPAVQGLRESLPFGLPWNRLHHLRRSPR